MAIVYLGTPLVDAPRLVAVPPPAEFEAVSSWLPRLALSQGTDLLKVAELFGVELNADTDRDIIGDKLIRLREICCLPSSAFGIAQRIMESLDMIGPAADRLLARSTSGRPRFRFCAACLAEMRIPHYPIHWRFIAWRRCPVHDCLLEDTCPDCGASVVLPWCIQRSAAGRAGYANLDRCRWCTARFASVIPCSLQVGRRRLVDQSEEQMLSNGRALLAALVRRSFSIERCGTEFSIESLAGMIDRPVLPKKFDWLSPNGLRCSIT